MEHISLYIASILKKELKEKLNITTRFFQNADICFFQLYDQNDKLFYDSLENDEYGLENELNKYYINKALELLESTHR